MWDVTAALRVSRQAPQPKIVTKAHRLYTPYMPDPTTTTTMRSNLHSLQGSKLLRLVVLLLFTPSIFVRAQEADSEAAVDQTLYNASYWSSTNYGGSRDGPFGVSLSDWDSHFDSSPNATHTVPLPIPDLTTRYSERALNDSTLSSYQGSGWNWKISLADSIPVPREPDQSPGLTTGVQVRLNAPENITSTNSNSEGMDDSWQLCIIRWHLKEGEGTNSSTFARLRSRDDCNGAVSRVCIRDLEAYAASGPDAFGRCRCPDPMAFESCKGEWFPSWSICSQAPYRASEIRDWKDGSLPVFSYAGPPRDEDADDDDNLLGYNATGHIVWPVMVVWGRRGDTSSSTITESRTSLATATATRAGTITISSATSSVSSSSSSSSTSTLSSLSSLTGSAVSPLSTAGSDDTNNNNKRKQSNYNDGSSSSGSGGSGSGSSQSQAQAIAKLSCLAVREAEEGSVLPGPPLREKNAASHGKFASGSAHLHVLIAVWGLVVGYMALL